MLLNLLHVPLQNRLLHHLDHFISLGRGRSKWILSLIETETGFFNDKACTSKLEIFKEISPTHLDFISIGCLGCLIWRIYRVWLGFGFLSDSFYIRWLLNRVCTTGRLRTSTVVILPSIIVRMMPIVVCSNALVYLIITFLEIRVLFYWLGILGALLCRRGWLLVLVTCHRCSLCRCSPFSPASLSVRVCPPLHQVGHRFLDAYPMLLLIWCRHLDSIFLGYMHVTDHIQAWTILLRAHTQFLVWIN
jgi:hypothetical protein